MTLGGGLDVQNCRCEEPGFRFPLASFCSDDLFCPQCGGRVAWLRSPNELPNPDKATITTSNRILWVYATELGGKGNRFTFLLEYHSLNENRVKRPRRLILDDTQSRVEPHNWPYKFLLRIIPGPEPHQVHIRLEPDQVLVREYGETEWAMDDGLLPAGGVFCTLTLVGNCGKETFGLLVCGEPRYEIEVQENGQRMVDSPPDDVAEPIAQAWALSRWGPHELTILIKCVKGFLHLPENMVRWAGPESPGQRSARSQLFLQEVASQP